MIREIGEIMLFVNNQEEAIAFWTQEVGPSTAVFTTFVLYDKADMQAQNPNTNVGHPSVLLSTQDIEATYNALSKKGVEVGNLLVMPYGKMFTFKDQDGNDFMVREDR